MKFSRNDLPDLSVLRTMRTRFARRRQWLIGSTLIVAGVTAAAFTLTPRTYIATGGVSLNSRMAAALSGAASGSEAVRARNSEMRVLTSADIAGHVADTLGLARRPGYGLPDGDPAEARARAVARIVAGLEAEPQGNSHKVTLRYAANDPALAAAVVNRTLERYVALRGIAPVEEEDPAPLRRRIDRAREGVIRADAALAEYRGTATPAPVQAEAPRAAGATRRDVAAIDAQLRDAVREEAALARQRWLTRTGGSNRGRGAEEMRLRAQRAELAERVGSIHPDVAVIDARLAAIASDRGRGTGATVAAMTEQLEVLRRRIADLRAARQTMSSQIGQSSRVETAAPSERRIATLQKRAERARDRYAALLAQQQRIAAAKLAAQHGAFIVARATPPAAPVAPRGWLYALSGLVAAVLAALAIAFGDDLLARGFRSRAHAERKLGIPVIGMVPDLNQLPVEGGAKAARVDPADYLFFDGRSPFTAAFRAIHTGLRLGAAANSPRSVAVSSALPDEGKTTVSICLARSAALAGLRVLLIDCDVRHPAATRALAAHVSVGLIEVLRDGAAIKDAVLRDTPSGAWILGHTNNGGEGSDELIGSPAMEALIATLSREFDLIVLDTPPALALDEARGVAAMADSVLLVARWHKTPVEATRIALEQLTRAGANVIAAALTLVGR